MPQGGGMELILDTTTKRKAILAIGAIMADVICHVPALPRSGEGVVVEQMAISVGGCAFNAADIIRLLGQPYRLFAPIGKGVYADYLNGELNRRGIEALAVNTEADFGACICMVEPDGERTMLTLPGVDRHFSQEWFSGVNASDYSCALVFGYEIEGEGGDAIIAFLENNPQLPVVYAPGPRICGVGKTKTDRINALQPLWHINALEACTYTKTNTLQEAGQQILEQCQNTVIITDGAKGAYLFSPTDSLFAAAQAVKPVDTVGAGDAHIGTLVAARNAGYSWQEALLVANRVSSALCRTAGATFTNAEFEQLNLQL
jgi:sugar/nucleoside kinase (ribokinase family)